MTFIVDNTDRLPTFYQLLARRQAWITHAECRRRGLPTAMFYAERHEHYLHRAARAACMACPVWLDCLDVGLSERWGLWGGFRERDRRAIKRRLNRGMSLADAARKQDKILGYTRQVPAPQRRAG